MASIIEDLKAQARILHRLAIAEDPRALARLAAARVGGRSVQRHHCLTLLARELGFSGWPHVLSALDGQPVPDFGTLLYPPACGGHSNIWSASYEEARSIRAEHGGYLLPYKHQFFIVEPHFLESLGVDAADPDWERIGRDWVQPGDPEARKRLCEKVMRARQQSLAPLG